MTDQTIALLEEIRDALTGRLGFGGSPWPVRVFVNRTNGGLWYTMQDDKPQPIPQQSLTGIIERISFETVTRRDKEVSKLQVTVKADQTYILECGYDCQFAKSFLAACSIYPLAGLCGKVVTICPQPGSDESVLFCRLFVDGTQVRAEIGEDPDWRAIAKAAMDSVLPF